MTRSRYLLAPSVAEKDNVTWAGQVKPSVLDRLTHVTHHHSQTFGARFHCDGRLSGTEDIQTIQCDTTANTCQIPVPAPGVALVFISSDAQGVTDPTTTQTYSTTAVTNPAQTLTIDPTALARSNGHGGKIPLGGTSKGGLRNAARRANGPHASCRSVVFTFLFSMLLFAL